MNGLHPPYAPLRRALVACAAVASVGAAAPVAGHDGNHHSSAATLGRVEFAVSCTPQAQTQFTEATALLHHMTYPQAREAFEKTAAADPGCAMAHWGIAMTLFQPLWPTRPGPDALKRGWHEVQEAKALVAPTERERLFIAATEAFFLDPASPDYWARVQRWEAAMRKTYDAFPDDPEAMAFYALAHLAASTTPENLRAHADEAAELLLRVYARNPDHPGAMHYLVHANDVPGRERVALDITRKYDAVAPSNPHALHMPTHIYTRLGDWDASIRGNLQAAEAALHTRAGEKGQYVWDEFPHAVEYLVYAYLQKGDDAAALAQVERLRATPSVEPSFKTAFHLASTQARYALERHDWAAAAAIVPREPASLNWDRFAWPEAVARFARGVGSARLGKLDAAQAELDRMQILEGTMRSAGESLFARNIEVLRLELAGWIAQARGQADASVALLRQAAQIEADTPKHAVTPAPTMPALEQLGDLLLERGQPAEALEAYQRSLQLYPLRFGSLLGAARAARASGNESVARASYSQLLDIAGGTSRPAIVSEARRYAAQLRGR